MGQPTDRNRADQDRRNIFEENARRLFTRLSIPRAQEAASR